MGYAVVFSGQGMQHPAMLPWLEPSGLLASAAARLGVGDWRDKLGDAAWLSGNRQAQVLLTACALAAWHQVARDLPPPAVVAGYSVGELAAYSAAGVFTADTALALADRRAAAMDACAQRCPGGLLGITGWGRAQVQALCAAHGLHLAIDNGTHSAVLGGAADSLHAAALEGTAQGAHCVRLPVQVASHTPLMAAAGRTLADALQACPMSAPTLPLLAGIHADRVHDVAQARDTLSAQIHQTIRWDDCMEAIHARGVRCVLEVGPGQALARLWSQRFGGVPARSVDEFRSAGRLVAWVRQCLAA